MAVQGEPLIIDFIYGILNGKRAFQCLRNNLGHCDYFSFFGLTYDPVM
jgi:hypothetical protein